MAFMGVLDALKAGYKDMLVPKNSMVNRVRVTSLHSNSTG
jgi:hypothetical protein